MRSRALVTTRSAHRATVAGVAVLALTAGLTACTSPGGGSSADGPGQRPGGQSASETARPQPVRLSTSFTDPASVPIDAPVSVSASGGTLDAVQVTSSAGDVTGEVADGSWTASSLLEPGTDYTITATATRSDGHAVERTRSFHTVDLTLDQQTFPSVAPLNGETVGVGMPVVVTFDLPVTDKALFEKHMHVTSSPEQKGSWYWLSDREAHFRPAHYWKPGTDVSVDVDVNSLPAGNGIFGQESRSIDFHIGDSVVSKVDVDTHLMRTFINGTLARTMPISAGKAGWETRSGTKVIIEKFRRKTMNAATIGVDESDPEYYNLSNVEYAMRVTYSGEFIHAAPWSVGSQGSANVSHGCVGMSLADAQWLYDRTSRGDVVEVSGSERQMTLDNGYGDWNLSPQAWRKGSALS
ncbi:L,D-transpeptidase [Nocardioides hwasunensis]|uniref:L,D-transpeptidase family protein n=1 Tax=Nocardioides hwasunensis TaxID=397258 RepID=A0ABR8MCY1_9ACTN|nr:Ig-like domain-containing protein [Nocardioides hwasunensis]MBD3913375.1 L,D-transpeptidase family protein [Nocardioides hwasunensis]